MRFGPTLRGKPGHVYLVEFSLAYAFGHVYLDRCGRTIDYILREYPEWLTSEVGTQRTSLISVANGAVFSFGSSGLSLLVERRLDQDLDEAGVNAFVAQADSLCVLVCDQLGLREYQRLSFRMGFSWLGDSEEDVARWLNQLRAVEVASDLLGSFGGALESMATRFVVASDDRRYAIEIKGVERQGELATAGAPVGVLSKTLSAGQRKTYERQLAETSKFVKPSIFASVIHVETFLINPEEIAPGDFVETGLSEIPERLAQAFPAPGRAKREQHKS